MCPPLRLLRFWISLIDGPARRFTSLCEARGWGLELHQGHRISLLLFADNVWLGATNSFMLSAMGAVWQTCLVDVSLSFTTSLCCWCSTVDDAVDMRVTIDGETVERRPRKTGFKALGQPADIPEPNR